MRLLQPLRGRTADGTTRGLRIGDVTGVGDATYDEFCDKAWAAGEERGEGRTLWSDISQLSQPAKAAKNPGLLSTSLTRGIVSSQFTLLMLISSRSRLPVDVSFNADNVERMQ